MELASSFEYFLGLAVGLIGIATFILSLLNRAKQDGVMLQKIDMLIVNVDEIRNSLHENEILIRNQSNDITKHNENITTLFTNIKRLDGRLNDVERKIERECGD